MKRPQWFGFGGKLGDGRDLALVVIARMRLVDCTDSLMTEAMSNTSCTHSIQVSSPRVIGQKQVQ
jgi:hypothetical protein